MEQQEAKQEAQLVGEAEEARQREAQLAEATAQARLACLLLHTPCALLVHCLCTACALLVHGLCTACARLVHGLCTVSPLLPHNAQTQQRHCSALLYVCDLEYELCAAGARGECGGGGEAARAAEGVRRGRSGAGSGGPCSSPCSTRGGRAAARAEGRGGGGAARLLPCLGTGPRGQECVGAGGARFVGAGGERAGTAARGRTVGGSSG